MKLARVKQLAQYWANRTGESTDAYRTKDGTVRFTVTGWPLKGTFLLTAQAETEAKAA